MLVTFDSEEVKIPAAKLKEMTVADIVRYILDQPVKKATITLSSVRPITVSDLNQEIPVQLSIILKAG